MTLQHLKESNKSSNVSVERFPQHTAFGPFQNTMGIRKVVSLARSFADRVIAMQYSKQSNKNVHYLVLLLVIFGISSLSSLIMFTLTIPNVFDNRPAHTTPITLTSASDSLNNKKHVTKSLAELEAVPMLSGHVLFFNRIPDTGSEVIVLLLQRLQGYNGFRHVRLKGGDVRSLSHLQQEKFVEDVTDAIRQHATPLSFDRYVHFVNFTSFDRQSPTYFNIIRDPIDKVLSRFYNNDGSFESCIEAGAPECLFTEGYPYDLTIPYFCGQDVRCMLLNDLWALKQAKLNVERYFPIVGALEELNCTLELLENTLPLFFRGVQQMYYKDLHGIHINKTRTKKISPKIRSYLQNALKTEYEFYNWIKARLFEQSTIMYAH